jgi:predicted component of type VI protein secretion system
MTASVAKHSRLICHPILEEGKTMSVSPISANSINQTFYNGISRTEATEIVRNALNEFQNRASEPLISLLTDSNGNSGGWLEALAKALGDKLNESANSLKSAAGAVNADNPGQTTELSAKAQEFAQFMDAVNNVIKTLGEALDSMVRKQ